MTAQRGLRLIALCPYYGIEPFFTFTYVSVAPEEIHRARPEAEQLRHPRVVVILFRKVAVGAVLRRAHTAGGVRKMRIERLTAVTFGAHRLLLRIHPFAIGILRPDDYCR